ncbi:class I mannose-6-phosphate isomerase, partial [Paenibacillus sp. 1001270B_150601_E10]|uniref:class I mannose-6-phosphate isomerase n=1 Tax=Paenibacillus sp. 1001270B_150601_E10 TaxID=2787079 RepID=UPI001E34E7B6
GYESFTDTLLEHYQQHKGDTFIVALDGTNGTDFVQWLDVLRGACIDQEIPFIDIHSSHYMKETEELFTQFHPYLTDNRAFGYMASDVKVNDYFQPTAEADWQYDVSQLLEHAEQTAGSASRPAGKTMIVTAGPGARFLSGSADVSLFCDVSRELQQKLHRAGLGSLGLGECKDPVETYKHALFLEWPVWEQYRKEQLYSFDYYVDMNEPSRPVILTLPMLKQVLETLAGQPFRVKPFFAPGIWGGQYLKKLCHLPEEEWDNCAWSFEPIAPENTLLAGIDDHVIELPFPLLLQAHPAKVLGSRNVERFGDYFPIRFNYLDTIDGDNLSLQVHPQQAYLEKTFNDRITQQESYYIMEQKPGSKPYVALGFAEGMTGEKLLEAVDKAHETHVPLDLKQYVNVLDAQKGDLFMIPPGAVHLSGPDNLVLEISSTTWWFTFKIYDHLRLDKDGKPRPINRDHAAHNMIERFDTAYVEEHLIAKPEVKRIQGDSVEELLGEREDLLFQVKRLRLNGQWVDETNGSFVMYNLVEGERVRLIPENNKDAAVEWGYAEAHIVPADVGQYRLESIGDQPCTLIRAQVSPSWHTPLLPHHWKVD